MCSRIALLLKTWRATTAIRGPEEGFPLAEVDNMGALVQGAIARGAKTTWWRFVKISRIALEAIVQVRAHLDNPSKNEFWEIFTASAMPQRGVWTFGLALMPRQQSAINHFLIRALHNYIMIQVGRGIVQYLR